MKTIRSVDDLQAEVGSSSGLVIIVFLGNAVDRFREDELLKELEVNYQSRVRFIKVSPEAKEVWEKFRISGQPVYLFFHNGEVVRRVLGRLSQQEFEEIITSVDEQG